MSFVLFVSCHLYALRQYHQIEIVKQIAFTRNTSVLPEPAISVQLCINLGSFLQDAAMLITGQPTIETIKFMEEIVSYAYTLVMKRKRTRFFNFVSKSGILL